MAKKKVEVLKPVDSEWELPEGFNEQEFDILPSGLPPLWKPQAGNLIYFRPDHVEPFKTKKGKKGKTIKENYAIAGILVAGETLNFFNSDQPASVKVGDRVTIGASYNLIGSDKLITEKGELSTMAESVLSRKACFLIRFDGKVKTGTSGRTVNRYTVGVPKGIR